MLFISKMWAKLLVTGWRISKIYNQRNFAEIFPWGYCGKCQLSYDRKCKILTITIWWKGSSLSRTRIRNSAPYRSACPSLRTIPGTYSIPGFMAANSSGLLGRQIPARQVVVTSVPRSPSLWILRMKVKQSQSCFLSENHAFVCNDVQQFLVIED